MMIVMSIVFSYMFGSNVPNFPLYLIVGNVTFSLMSDSTNAALTSIINAAPLLKKVKVNRYIFPVQKVLFALVNFAFSLIAVAIVMLFFQVMPTWHFIWLPLCLFLLMLFCIGVGLAIGALSVFFRDIITCGASSLSRGPTSRPSSGISPCLSTRAPRTGSSCW